MLLPSDLRDWVREDDMVHFVIETASYRDVAERYRLLFDATGARECAATVTAPADS